MNPSRLSVAWLVLVLASCEANGQGSAPAVPWVTTRPSPMCRPKGSRPSMPADAKAVIDKFVQAADANDWEKALTYCSRRTNSRAVNYDREDYLREFVPIARLKAEKSYSFWTYAQDRPDGEYHFFGCFVELDKTSDGDKINWEWWLERTAKGWLIDLPDVPVERWKEEEIARLKRHRDKAEARWNALEPKLKGLRTQLTAVQREYKLGGAMPFRLELVNEGEHELSYDDQQVDVNGSMIIKDEDGQVVPYTAGPYQTGGIEKPIRPGERAVLFESLDIAKQYAIKKTGKYEVQFSGRGLMVGDAIGSKGGASRVQFPSNTVEIDVKP